MPSTLPPNDTYQDNVSYDIGWRNDDWLIKYKTAKESRFLVTNDRRHVIGSYSNAHKRDKHGVYRGGGNWAKWEWTTTMTPSGYFEAWRPGNRIPWYEGHFVVQAHNGNYYTGAPQGWASDSFLQGQLDNLEKRGAEAWNKLRPDMPDFSLATNIAELRELPMLLHGSLKGIIDAMLPTHTKRWKANDSSVGARVAEWHLAAQFGYLPVLGAIRDFVKTQRNAQRRLAQLIRDAGKPVRRKTFLRDQTTSNSMSTTYEGYNGGWDQFLFPRSVTQAHWFHPKLGRVTRRFAESKTWAVGKFYYYLPPGPRDVAWNRKMMRRIFGSRITPRELYQVMPWSWLLDYFTGLGNFISATSAGVADRLVCEYAYIMQTQKWAAITDATLGIYVDGGSKLAEVRASIQSVDTIKLRHAASPFGWGFKDGNLTPMQLSILGALGRSRLG